MLEGSQQTRQLIGVLNSQEIQGKQCFLVCYRIGEKDCYEYMSKNHLLSSFNHVPVGSLADEEEESQTAQESKHKGNIQHLIRSHKAAFKCSRTAQQQPPFHSKSRRPRHNNKQ